MIQNISLSVSKEIRAKWKWLSLIDWLLPAYIVFSFPMFYWGWHLDFVFKGLAIVITLFYVIRFRVLKSKIAKVFTVFLLLVLFSFIQYIYNDRPIELYINDVTNYVAAMLFFYIGSTDDRAGRPFYTKLVYATTIIFTIGLLYYVTLPGWFLSRTVDAINMSSLAEYNETNVLGHMRFGAFWGNSYPVSHLSVFCVAIAIFDLGYSEDRKKLLALLCLIIGLLSSFASMHRASIIGSALAMVIYFYFNHVTARRKDNVYLIIAGIALVLGAIAFMPDMSDRIDDIIAMVTNRVNNNMSLENALKERKFTTQVMQDMRFYFFGHGLGAASVGARAYGFPGISDMQYIKMFYENGVVGAFLFIVIIITAIKRGIKYIGYYLTEIVIIAFILVAMLGSNSLSIYYMFVFPFWYAVGRICNNDYFRKMRTNTWI